MRDIGTIELLQSQRDRWKQEAKLLQREVAEDPTNARALFWRSGGLAPEWARRFPELFDEDDRRLVESQGKDGGHHIEWLGAIVLYHTTGYLSLIAKYQFSNHPRKVEIREKLRFAGFDSELLAIVRGKEHGSAQGPDLLAYTPDFSDWFFCEIKGPGDDVKPEQKRKFKALEEASGKPVRRLNFIWAPDPGRTAAGRTVPLDRQAEA